MLEKIEPWKVITEDDFRVFGAEVQCPDCMRYLVIPNTENSHPLYYAFCPFCGARRKADE